MGRYISAELIRARGSALQWLPLLAVPLVLVTFALSQAVNADEGATGILMWQAVYLTGLAAPLATLFGAVAESRERNARQAGTQWRGVSQQRQRAARLLVVLMSLAVFHVVNFGGTWLLSIGREGSSRILLLGVFAFIGAAGITGLGMALARVSNLIVAVIFFLLWQLSGIVAPVVEGSYWWAWPAAWPVRLVLPIMGVHQNAVPLEPGDPLGSEQPWLALALCAVLCVAGGLAAVRAPERVRRPKRRKRAAATGVVGNIVYTPAVVHRSGGGHAHGRVRPRPLLAISRAGLGPALVGCLVASVLVMAATAVIYPPSYTHGLFVFAILPIGAGFIPVLVWPQMKHSWAVMRTEAAHPERTLLLWSLLVVAAVSLCASLLGLVAGGSAGDEARRFLLSTIVGYVLVAIAYVLMLRFGMAVTLAVIIILTIFSITLGGDVLAEGPLWVLAFPSWPETATDSGRLATAVGAGGVLAALLHWRAARVLGAFVE